MRAGGSFVAILGAVVLVACATQPLAPPAVDVTGRWAGTWEFQPSTLGTGTVVADLQQSGWQVTGNLNVSGPSRRLATAEGVVRGNEYRLLGPVGGTLVVQGDTMTGEVNGIFPAKVILTRQR